MGAFLLVHKQHNYNTLAVEEVFKKKGFSEPAIYEAGNWKLFYFGKIVGLPKQVLVQNGHIVVVCGTLVYKSQNAENSFKAFSEDLIYGKLDKNELLGDYAIIHINPENKIEVTTSPSNIYNVFYDESKKIWSSSFLAIKAFRNKNTLNNFAALENVLSGNIIGPDTLINEIKRLEPESGFNSNELSVKVSPAQPIKAFFKGNIYEAVDYQLQVLGDYFKAVKNFADDAGADAGLTSGFDSRLILSQMLKYWSNFQIHGHYRKKKDAELSISEKVAESVGLPMVQVPVTPPLDIGPQEMNNQLADSYYFCDGLIRMHGFWTEEYNTAKHRIDVLGNKRLGISGIGGEQYRNMDHLFWNKYSFRDFVKYKTVFALSGSCFQDKKSEDAFFDYLSEKLRKKLGIGDKAEIGKLEVKRYWNEIFIPARLGGRNNSENQVSYFLSPFTEDRVAKAAYEIIPQLGIAHQFQMLMISRTNLKLAAAPSDYGYPFHQKIPAKEIVKAYIKGLMPDTLTQKRLDKIILSRNTKHFENMKGRSAVLENAYKAFHQNAFPVKEEMLIKQPDLMPLMLQLGYFINSI